jgi:outer membrane receptor for ferrienterochelin and colicins
MGAVCTVLSVAAALYGSGARAQSVDYGALEQLFGEPITTSVTGKPQKASDVPADLVILTQDDIRRSGADNIPDILRFVTGIDVRSYGLTDSEVGIRGYNQPLNPRLLVMVNGRQVYLDDYGYVAWSTIPVQLDEIRQIEVVKGPNSALFGFNAASGVINIITLDPLKDNTNAVTVRTGTQNLVSASVVGTAHLSETAGIRLSAGGFAARDFSGRGLNAFDSADRPRPKNGAFNLEGSWQILPTVQIIAEAGMVDSRTGLKEIQGSYVDQHYRISTTHFSVTADSQFGLLAFDVFRNQARNSNITGLASLDQVNTVYVAKVSDLFKVNADHTIRLGLEYRNNAATGPIFEGTIGYQVYSAEAMWNWQVTQSVSVTNAVRVDHLSLHLAGSTPADTPLTTSQYNHAAFTEPSFNSSIVWKVTGDDTLRLTAARGLQVPSLFDYAFQFETAATGTLYFGNPILSPTAVWNTELAYDRNVPSIGSALRTGVFLQRNTNLLASGPAVPAGLQASNPFASQSANIGSSDEVGLEIGIKGKSASGWRWNASYSFASINDHLAAGYATTPSLDYRRGTPQHTVILGGGYSIGKWEIDAQARWQSRFQDYKSTGPLGSVAVEVPNYVTFSARVGYRLTEHLTVSGTAEQFNISRIESAGPPVERRLIAAMTARF